MCGEYFDFDVGLVGYDFVDFGVEKLIYGCCVVDGLDMNFDFSCMKGV